VAAPRFLNEATAYKVRAKIIPQLVITNATPLIVNLEGKPLCLGKMSAIN